MANLVRKINNTVLDFVRGIPFQTLNKFEINLSLGNELLSSGANANGGGALANIAQAIYDFGDSADEPSFDKIVRIGTSIILQLYAQSVTISLPEIETGSLVNGVKYIKDIKMPEDFEITFLEDELGLTLRFIDLWRLKIVGYDNYVMYSDRATSKTFESKNSKGDLQTSSRPTTQKRTQRGQGYLAKINNESVNEIQNFSGSTLDFFNDEWTADIGTPSSANRNIGREVARKYTYTSGIEAYKANMTLKPLSMQDDLGIPPFPSFQLKGVFPKSIDSMTFSQDSQEFMIHKVKFSVDTIYTRFI